MNLTQSEIKYLRLLQQKKNRETERKFLLEGWRPLRDALESNFITEMIAVLPEASQNDEHRSILAYARKRNIPVKELKELQLRQISDAVHSQGVVALVRQQVQNFDTPSLRSAKYVVACDHVSDPGNLGTILRTCDWFGVDTILLSEGCVSLYNEKVVRATAGSIFHVKIYEHLSLEHTLPQLQADGFTCIATALNKKPITLFEPNKKYALVLGNEAHGVRANIQKLADEVISIPRYGKAESLNVGIACGIVLSQWRNLTMTK